MQCYCRGKCDPEKRTADRSWWYRLKAHEWARMGHMELALSYMETSAMLRRKLTTEFGWASPIPQ